MTACLLFTMYIYLFAINNSFLRDLLPYLRSFKQRKLREQREASKEEFRFEYFAVPKFLFGEMTNQNASDDEDALVREDCEATAEGVLVLEDLSAKGFSITDSQLMIMDYEHMKVEKRHFSATGGDCSHGVLREHTFIFKRLITNHSLFKYSKIDN